MASEIAWDVVYTEICSSLHINCMDDDTSANYLSGLRDRSYILWERLRTSQNGNFIVVGNGPDTGADDLYRVMDPGEILVVADSAVRVIPDGVVPDIIVSDLDGNISVISKMVEEGSILFLHAHGDNLKAISGNIQVFNGFYIPTRQGPNPPSMFNPHGFTDGDRAVMICRYLGAKRIKLLGFSYEKPFNKGDMVMKMKKLKFAKRIIDSIDDVEIVYV
jgi:hypothetical protein